MIQRIRSFLFSSSFSVLFLLILVLIARPVYANGGSEQSPDPSDSSQQSPDPTRDAEQERGPDDTSQGSGDPEDPSSPPATDPTDTDAAALGTTIYSGNCLSDQVNFICSAPALQGSYASYCNPDGLFGHFSETVCGPDQATALENLESLCVAAGGNPVDVLNGNSCVARVLPSMSPVGVAVDAGTGAETETDCYVATFDAYTGPDSKLDDVFELKFLSPVNGFLCGE